MRNHHFRLPMIALVLLACVAVAAPALAAAGPHGFPLPRDAKASGPAPGGGGKIVLYQVPRGRDAVAAELRSLLKANGWTITSDQASPRGSVRLVVKKGSTTIKASVAGDPSKAALILTLP